MQVKSLYDRIKDLSLPPKGEHRPPPEIVAFTIQVRRKFLAWKKSTLADFAGVSLSTVERAERGEVVSSRALEQIGNALGYERGYFTAPRRMLTHEEMRAEDEKTYRHRVFVPVKIITTQTQIRALAKCHLMMLHAPNVPEEHMGYVQQLGEWLDLTGFMISHLSPTIRDDERGRRDLYTDVLGHIREMNGRGLNVLAGTVEQPHKTLGTLKVAVVEITTRETDPAAAKRKLIAVDRRGWTPARPGEPE